MRFRYRDRRRWTRIAHIPLPPDHPLVVEHGQAGEVFYSELQVHDWQEYLAMLNTAGAMDRLTKTRRDLVLTTRRLLVVGPGWLAPVRFQDIERVEAISRPGMPLDDGKEMVIAAAIQVNGERRLFWWVATTENASLFVTMLRDFMTKSEASR
jgi:hypothetical protein